MWQEARSQSVMQSVRQQLVSDAVDAIVHLRLVVGVKLCNISLFMRFFAPLQ